MITRLEVENFRSIQDGELLDFKDINLLYGPNNAGKSSALHALGVLAQSTHSPNFSGDIVDLNSFEETVFQKSTDSSIRIVCCVELSDDVTEELQQISENTPYEDFLWEEVEVELEISMDDGDIYPSIFSIRSGDKQLVGQRDFPNGPSEETQIRYYPDMSEDITTGSVIHTFDFKFTEQYPDDREGLNPGKLTDRVKAAVKHHLDDIEYLHPNRFEGRRTQSVNNERYITKQGENIINRLHYLDSNHSDQFEKIADWVEKFGIGDLDTTLDSGVAIPNLEDEILKTPINIQEIGYGTSQLLPFIILGFDPKAGDILIVEEPEMHLHPKAQQTLFDLFEQIANEGKQIFATTHSESLLYELLDRGGEIDDFVRVFKVSKSDTGTQFQSQKPQEIGRVARSFRIRSARPQRSRS